MELSIVAVQEDTDETIGVLWGLDHHSHAQDPEFKSEVFRDVFEFVLKTESEHVKKIFGDNTPHRTAYEPFYLATKRSLSHQENLEIATALEEENLRLAKRLGFKAILSMNTGPVTQHLAIKNRYERLEEIQINQFVSSSGERIFASVSDDVKVTIDLYWL